jgi:drug/metabolite transporter (DMT)-like permease
MLQQPQSMNLSSWALLLLLSVLWGSSFFFAGVSVREVPPLTVVLIRVGLAVFMLLPIFWYYGYKLPSSFQSWMPFIGMGVLNNVIPFGLLFYAQTQITVGLVSIINAMTPLFTVVVMTVFCLEKLTINRFVGVLLGVIGVVVLQGFGRLLDGAQGLGIILGLGATLSYGFSALWARLHLTGVPPLKSATCQLICSTLIMIVVVSIIEQPWTLEMPSIEACLSLLGMAVFGTAIAYIVFFKILVSAGASNVMLVTLLIPITAVMLGNIFLDEVIQSQEIIGALVIGFGLLFIDGRILKLFTHKS